VRGLLRGDDPDEFAAIRRRQYRLLLLAAASAILFAGGLLVTESVGEIAVDVDLKPFFLPFLLLTLVRFGLATMSIGVGAALGEGILDVFEGYELDDPVGFLGYAVGFVLFAYYLDQVADDPTTSRSLTVAAVLGALVQAVFEGLAFLIFDPEAGVVKALVSMAGNTVTHGLLLGAIPLVLLHPTVVRRFDDPVA
jgi:hypothetical protein